MHYSININMDLLKSLREVNGLERDADLARAMGITQAALSRTLRGLSRPGPRFIGGLKKAFPGVSYDNIIQAHPLDEEQPQAV